MFGYIFAYKNQNSWVFNYSYLNVFPINLWRINMNKNKNIGIILAGGVGSRMGLSYPKQFSKLQAKLRWSILLPFSKNIKKLMKLSSFLSVPLIVVSKISYQKLDFPKLIVLFLVVKNALILLFLQSQLFKMNQKIRN